MANIFYPPINVPLTSNKRIFLAGSIEMNKAVDWQQEFISQFESEDVSIFNPRRTDWDNTITQSKDDSRFREQVEWELIHLTTADLIVMYLQPGTISPISLLELGLYATKNIVVCCPEGFHRRGNVQIVCEHYNIPVVDDLYSLINIARKLL